MKNLMIAVLAMGFVGVANAADFRSEGHYQANAGETFLEGTVQYNSATQEFKGGGELDMDRTNFRVGVEHGLSEHYSLYFHTGFGDMTLKAGGLEGEADGMLPLNFGTNITHETSMGHIISNFNLEYHLDKADGENLQNGSTNLSGMIGHRFDLGHANWGLKLGLDIVKGDTEDEAGNEGEVDSGHSLTAFYETMIMEQTVGLAEVSYMNDGDNTDLGLHLHARYDVDEQMNVYGGFMYSMNLDSDNELRDGGNGLGLMVGLRYAM